MLAALLNAVEAGVGLLRQGRFYRVNEYLVRMTGYPAGELLGRHWSMLCADGGGEVVMPTCRSASATRAVASRWQRADGVVIGVLVSVVPLGAGDFELDSNMVLTAVVDRQSGQTIPAPSTVAAESGANVQRLLRTERLNVLGSITASILHECNNPLCGIRTMIERQARAAGQTGDDRRMLDLALAQCDRMIGMIRAVRQFGEQDPEVRQRLDLDSLVDSGLLLISNHLKKNKVVVKRESAGTPLMVRGHANQLKQALLALVEWCGEYLGHSGGEVRLRTDRQGSAARIVIVAEQHGANQVLPAMASDVPGTVAGRQMDIGGQVFRHIIEVHGGEIVRENTGGRAMVLTVRLPMEDEEVCR